MLNSGLTFGNILPVADDVPDDIPDDIPTVTAQPPSDDPFVTNHNTPAPPTTPTFPQSPFSPDFSGTFLTNSGLGGPV